MNQKSFIRVLAASAACAVLCFGAPVKAQAEEGYFYQGAGPATGGPFSLLGGRYLINVWARMPVATNQPSCIFGGVLERVGTNDGVIIGKAVTLSRAMMPYHFAPTVTLAPGEYRFRIAMLTDCAWSAVIVTASGSEDPPGVAPVEAYAEDGSVFNRADELPQSKHAMFRAEYRAAGIAAQSLVATIQLSKSGKVFATYPAKIGKNENQIDIVYQYIDWLPADGRYLGPITVRLILKAGSTTAVGSGTFTVVK